MSFHAYLEQWVEIAKSTIQLNTYSTYVGLLNSSVLPYFEEKNIALQDLKPKDIQDFYTAQFKRVKASTVIHYHAIIHKALKYAVKIDLIPVNPATKVERPRQNRFVGSFYDSQIEGYTAILTTWFQEKCIVFLLISLFKKSASQLIMFQWPDCPKSPNLF